MAHGLTRREQIIEQMLRHYNEAEEVNGNGSGFGTGDLVPLTPATWNRSYQQLETLLDRMRTERKSQWWHVHQRYIAAQVAMVDAHITNKKLKLPPHCELAAGAPQVGAKTVRVRVVRWNPAVRDEKVRRGIGWLADHYHGEPFLPEEFALAA